VTDTVLRTRASETWRFGESGETDEQGPRGNRETPVRSISMPKTNERKRRERERKRKRERESEREERNSEVSVAVVELRHSHAARRGWPDGNQSTLSFPRFVMFISFYCNIYFRYICINIYIYIFSSRKPQGFA